MAETLLMIGLFMAGAGAGAVLIYARDRHLLHLYANLVQDLSRMVSRPEPESQEPPAMVARMPTAADRSRRAAS